MVKALALEAQDHHIAVNTVAGRIVQTLDREGAGFVFEVDKVTQYPDDFRTRMAWRASYDS